MLTQFRQGLVAYQENGSNLPNFLKYVNSNVTLNIAPTPTVVTFAHRNANYLIVFDVEQNSTWAPLEGHISYLYWDIDLLSAVVTAGVTDTTPTFGGTRPESPVNNQHWFDVENAVMLVWDASRNTWRERIRVFAGEISQSGVITHYQRGSQVGINTETLSGFILLDSTLKPTRLVTGEMLTSNTEVRLKTTSATSGVAAKPVNQYVFARAASAIPKFRAVKVVSTDTIALASPSDTVVGISLNDAPLGNMVQVACVGELVNDQWSWGQPGQIVWLGDDGSLVTTPSAGVVKLGVVKSSTTVILGIDNLLGVVTEGGTGVSNPGTVYVVRDTVGITENEFIGSNALIFPYMKTSGGTTLLNAGSTIPASIIQPQTLRIGVENNSSTVSYPNTSNNNAITELLFDSETFTIQRSGAFNQTALITGLAAPSGGGSVARPLNEVVFGTGSSVTSIPTLTVDTTDSAIISLVPEKQSGFYIGDSSFRYYAAPRSEITNGSITLYAADDNSETDIYGGGSVEIYSGSASTSFTGQAGNIELRAGFGETGGNIIIASGNNGVTDIRGNKGISLRTAENAEVAHEIFMSESGQLQIDNDFGRPGDRIISMGNKQDGSNDAVIWQSATTPPCQFTLKFDGDGNISNAPQVLGFDGQIAGDYPHVHPEVLRSEFTVLHRGEANGYLVPPDFSPIEPFEFPVGYKINIVNLTEAPVSIGAQTYPGYDSIVNEDTGEFYTIFDATPNIDCGSNFLPVIRAGFGKKGTLFKESKNNWILYGDLELNV
jgi:hypothetical protein